MEDSEQYQTSNQDALLQSQRELEDNFDGLKGDGLKSLLEKLFSQGEQKNAASNAGSETRRNVGTSSDSGVPYHNKNRSMKTRKFLNRKQNKDL